MPDVQSLEEEEDTEMDEEASEGPEEPGELWLPADVDLGHGHREFFDYVRDKMSLDITIRFYLPHGTGPVQRNFVVRTLIAFSPWRARRQYNAPADVIDDIVAQSSLSSTSNWDADAPFHVQFGTMQSLCSALVHIARSRHRWPVARRGQPKLFLRIDDRHDFFPFT
eukprot:gene11627-8281_t